MCLPRTQTRRAIARAGPAPLASSRLRKLTSKPTHRDSSAKMQESRCERIANICTVAAILEVLAMVKRLVPAAWTAEGIRGVLFLNCAAGLDRSRLRS